MELYAMKSFYDNRLGLVTLEDDVLSIVSQVRELYDRRVTVELDPDRGVYHFIEHCEDGTDRLIFTVDELDGRALLRLQVADSQRTGFEDPYDAAERAQDKAQADQEAVGREKVAEQGERLIHALKHSGLEDHLPLTVSIPKDVA